ncbi:MAG: hypothetical protein MIO92_13730, partial [Methanosarcinaceae archaeon]|nr:hypothetical protein [Methanosarcinaceae archaeon]
MINKVSLKQTASQDTSENMSVDFYWEQALLDGERTCSYQDGSGYSGMFRDGCFHGTGKFTWPDGSRYDGQWDDDLPHVRGTILLHD